MSMENINIHSFVNQNKMFICRQLKHCYGSLTHAVLLVLKWFPRIVVRNLPVSIFNHSPMQLQLVLPYNDTSRVIAVIYKLHLPVYANYPYYNCNTRTNMQHARLQVTTEPYYICQTRVQQILQDLHNSCSRNLISIILCKRNIMHEPATCSQSHSKSQIPLR